MDHTDFVRKGAATFSVDYDGPPRDFHFVLLNKLTMLAFSSAVEPLRIANQITGRPLYRWFTMTADGSPVRCSNNVLITPDGPLIDITKQDRSFVCSGVEPTASLDSKVTNWVRRQQAHGTQVGGICTGAFTLAATGALTNRRFTLHWENQPAFLETYSDLKPTPNLYEKDQGLMTCGGGSASTDMILDLIETDHSKELAIMVADMCLHSRSLNKGVRQQSAQAVALGTRNPRMIKAMELMEANLEDPIPIDELSAEVGLSRRQLERLFKRYLSETPTETYMSHRVARAHALLSETNLSITEIAMATGFSNPNQLSLRFRKRFGISPYTLRKGWAAS
jgi:transcriptional regulator GlxA family with amidase domain